MKTLLICVLATTLCVGVAAAYTIDDIQYYNPVTGVPASPYAGQTVTVSGTVYVQAGTYNGGSHYIQSANGGLQFFRSATGLVIGDIVELTGTVSTYQGEIQLNAPSFTLLGHTSEPTPTPTTPNGILACAEPYEWVGEFAAVTGKVVEKTAGQFKIMENPAGTDTMIVYIDADTGINIGAVDVGDVYLVKSPVVVYNTVIELKPRMQSDLIENPTGDTVPVIENVDMANWVVLSNAAATVTATITDNVGVASAQVYSRDSNLDGTVTGPWNFVAMTNTGGNVWSGTIPAPHSSAKLDFYVRATDTAAQSVTNPGDAPATFFATAVGITPIYQVQWANPDSSNQDSAYMGKVVNVRGIVTAGPGDAGAVSKFIIQEQNTGPYGGYRFGGLLVYEGSATFPEIYRGDVVEVAGSISEYYFLTEMNPHRGSAVRWVGFGNDLPPTRVHTRVLADDNMDDGNGRLAEPYESVWIKTYASSVMDTLGYGEYIISDTGARADSVVVAPYVVTAYEPTIGDLILVEGFMDYAYNAPRIVPLSDDWINYLGQVPVEDTPTVQPAGGFTAVYPNPFNPMTRIEFVLNKTELTQLNIYNLRGQMVRQLVQEQLPAGPYSLIWDGTDAQGHALASGQYFARLRIGGEVYQVRSLTLVK